MNAAEFTAPYRLDISEAHIAELRRQNTILVKQVRDMRALIQTIPSIITNARLDEKQGKPTHYDYDRAHRVTRVEIA